MSWYSRLYLHGVSCKLPGFNTCYLLFLSILNDWYRAIIRPSTPGDQHPSDVGLLILTSTKRSFLGQTILSVTCVSCDGDRWPTKLVVQGPPVCSDLYVPCTRHLFRWCFDPIQSRSQKLARHIPGAQSFNTVHTRTLLVQLGAISGGRRNLSLIHSIRAFIHTTTGQIYFVHKVICI